MATFGRRPNDSLADMGALVADEAPGTPFSFATLDFSEVLLSHDRSQLQIRRLDKGRRVLGPVGPAAEASFHALWNTVSEAFQKPGERDAAARFVTHEGLRFKVMTIETVRGGLYVCRRVRQAPAFASIEGIADPVRAHLNTLGRTQQSGLLVISGPPNCGKTTTLLSMVLHLAKAFEDVALIVEDLPEVRLNGIIQGSQGRIVQLRAIADPALYDGHLRSLLTLSPRLAAVGSIARPLDARLALDLALAGVLVVTTIDANDILTAIGNVINCAGRSMGAETARDAVALTLRGVLHQVLGDRDSSDDPNMRKLNVTSFFLPSPSDNQAMMRKIREGNIQSLASDILLQDARVRHNQAPLEDRDLSQAEALIGPAASKP